MRNKYTDLAISEALKKHGAFWAFSDKQYEAEAKPNTVYVSLGAGLICPKENVVELHKDIDEAVKNGIEQTKAETTLEEIITRTLVDYEGDTDDTFSHLQAYGITMEQIQEVANKLQYNFC